MHSKRGRFGGIFDKYEIKANQNTNKELGTHFHGRGRSEKYKLKRSGGGTFAKYTDKINHWDIAPPKEYFEELFRVSKNQIIWGGNYFDLPPTRCFIVWEKYIPETFSMAMCEYAWTSFNLNAKIFKHTSQGTKNEPRFHPTQKPVPLYTWILNNYAKKGDKILDTHLGSASNVIACIKGGFDYIGFEIDEEYFKQAQDRIAKEKLQISFFE